MCHWCGLVFKMGLSCCPNLLKVAIEMWSLPPEDQGPKTTSRVRKFLRQHKLLFIDYLPDALAARNFETQRLREIANALKIDMASL
jgi:hypothetical protein